MIDTRSLSQQVYDYLSEQIIQGRLSYGQRISMKQIGGELNVSTMPIRDALKRLEMENVVEVKPRSSCYVKVPTKKAVLDSVEARSVIETHALGKILPVVKNDLLGSLRDLVRRMEEEFEVYSRTGDLRQYIELDRLFHREIVSLAGNEYLQRFYREVNMHLNMQYRYGIGAPFNVELTLQDHKDLVRYLAENSRKAVEVLKEHLDRSYRNIISGKKFQSLPDR
jgi:DNA-binding GntR family transcriptional regulator